MSKSVKELRAIKYYLEQYPDERVELSLAHLVRFRDKVTGETIDRPTLWLISLYDQRERQKAARTKKMKGELKDGHKPEPNPIRSARRFSQTTIARNVSTSTEDPADDSVG